MPPPWTPTLLATTTRSIRLAEAIRFADIGLRTQARRFAERGLARLAVADIGLVPLLPSPFSDLCQPNKLFEYVAMNIPVIVARFRAIEETFDASAVTYFEPGSVESLAACVLELYADPARRARLARNALARYETLRWTVVKHDYVRIVETMLA